MCVWGGGGGGGGLIKQGMECKGESTGMMCVWGGGGGGGGLIKQERSARVSPLV